MKTSSYMNLLDCIVNVGTPSEETVTKLSLQELYDFSLLNKLIPITAEFLPHWNTGSVKDQQLIASWKNEALQLVFLEQKKRFLTKQIVQESQNRNLSLVFFKGYLLADLYKNFALRNSSDTDILIEKTDLEQIILLLEDLNYRPASELDTTGVYTFLYEEAGDVIHKIELHTSLYEDASKRELEKLNRMRLNAPEHIVPVHCCGLQINTLAPTEHLIYQMFHMVKHFCCHGFPARYLVDTQLFIRRYAKEIDWERFTSAMNLLGYEKFFDCLFSVFRHHFELSECPLAPENVYTKEAVYDFLQDILWFGARSYGAELSDAFYFFERYLEHQEEETGIRWKNITFDGTTVPKQIVALKYQQAKKLQRRILLLRELELI